MGDRIKCFAFCLSLLSILRPAWSVGHIRLAGGRASKEGRVEILIEGVWGTVCNSGWDILDGNVVCRMMNYKGAVRTYTASGGSGPIWLTELRCKGDETDVLNCTHGRLGQTSSCSHGNDAGVACHSYEDIVRVRLAGGVSPYFGRVEVKFNNTWGTIKGDWNWNINEAHVVCRMLNYTRAIAAIRGLREGRGKVWLQDVRCNGEEKSIDMCDHGGWGCSGCNHDDDAGVICHGPQVQSPDVAVRLVDRSTPNQGRVEVRYYGVWGTVCDDLWGLEDAHVVCRMLNYSKASWAGTAVNSGSGAILLDDVMCRGDENSLEHCRSSGWGKSNCDHSEDASVTCETATDANVAVRLVSASTPNEGRVEVRYYGVWGTVCDDGWGLADAHVVCRMLNYSKASWAGTAVNSGSGAILLDDVMCRGDENSLEHCRSSGWGKSNCDHSEDAGVTCEYVREDDVQVRLAEAVSPHFGRVEVKFNNTWGTIKGDWNWNINEAHVVCRMLNYTRAIAAIRGLREGRGKVWLHDIRCNGEEKSIDMCDHGGWGCSGCNHDDDAGVICHGPQVQDPNVAVRLVDGKTPNQGRVEVRYYGVWGTVCDDLWGLADAHVVCRMLNYSIASWAGTATVSGSGPILLDDVSCRGNETSLEQCRNYGLGQHNCNHSEDAGVKCENVTKVQSPDVAVRLVDGSTLNQGRVEVRYYGVWGTVCDDYWGLEDAHVVCRMLNYSIASLAGTARVSGSGPILLDDVSCRGNETSLEQCRNRGWGQHNCEHDEDAGVRCETAIDANVAVRLVDGRTPNEGRVEVRYYGVWGTVCDDGWGLADAHVVCRMLNYSKASLTGTFRVQGSGPILLDDVMCRGNERSLESCGNSGWGVHNCEHYEDVDVKCESVTNDVTSIRLVGEQKHVGSVEVNYKGTWRPVCDDTWDILDAQVVCRMLGYKAALAAIRQYMKGNSSVWMGGVECSGEEVSISECYHRGWSNTRCPGNYYAGVMCKLTEDPPPVRVRLEEGSLPYYGRVAVRYGNVWGTICNRGLDINDAKVICCMLGYVGAIHTYNSKPGNGAIWLSNLGCNGTEKSIVDCRHPGWGETKCSHDNDAGVICIKSPSNVRVRLVDDNVANAGRVEIRFHGVWKSVCDTKWDLREGNVVCRMLGYNQGAAVAIKGYQSVGDVWLSGVNCTGDEKSIERCNSLKWGKARCRSNRRAGVVCISGSSEKGLRLVDGVIGHIGRLEAYYYGMWGAVCADTIDLQDAHVVCRMMGYSQAVTIYKQSGDSFKFLIKVDCNGTESSTEQCNNAKINIYTCRSKKDAWIVCKPRSEHKEINIRLVNGSTPNEGRVEIQQYGVWGTVCNSDWDILDGNVVCRMMNFTGAISTRQQFGYGMGPIWLTKLKCKGDEKDILQCVNNGLGRTSSCSHGNDAGVLCYSYQVHKVSHSVQVRLEDGSSPNSGRVAVRYGNVWGTICNRGLDINDAKVICRMLGYVGGVRQYTSKPGNGTIWLSNLGCNGTEKSIVDCRHPGWGQTIRCNHDNDATILCKTANPPQFQVNGFDAITDSTVVILFNVIQPIERQLKSFYQVAVEKRDTVKRFKSYDQPLPFVFNEFNVTMATKMGSESYMTAEILSPISNLTIGDGQYYHGYYNAPLEPGSLYRVHVRIVTMAMDGSRIYGSSAFVAFQTKQDEEINKVKYYKEKTRVYDGCSQVAVIVLSLVIVILVVRLMMIASVCRCFLKERHDERNSAEGIEMKDIVDDSNKIP